MDQKIIDTVEEITSQLVSFLPLTLKVQVSPQEESVGVSIEGDDLGALIGYHGKTLSALQLFLGLAVQNKVGQWVPLLVDVGGWRTQKQESLTLLAEQVANQVVQTGIAQQLPYLSPTERRMVHVALTDHPQVISESEGDGEERRIVVKPRLPQ